MISEGTKPNYNEIVKTAETPNRIICRHDFWDKVKAMEFGDIILCQRCNQYFTKIKHLIRVTRPKPFETIQSNGIPVKGILKAKPEHWDVSCMVRVPVRIVETDNEDRD